MKKFIVIVTMIFSATAMTACGNNTNNKNNENTTNVPENQNTDDNENNSQEEQDQNDLDNTDADNNTDSDNKDTDLDKEDTNDSDINESEKDDENDKTDNEESDSQEELIETGKEPDIKVNKKGRFNGRYEGSDGCIYEFTKKGKLTITSDSEVIEYIYQLDGDRLSMVTIDETMGIGRQITLLEDGTYLLDDTLGNQVILTYIED